jgi:hypothetical protein
LDYRGPLERTNSTRSPASDRHNGLIDLFRPNYPSKLISKEVCTSDVFAGELKDFSINAFWVRLCNDIENAL